MPRRASNIRELTRYRGNLIALIFGFTERNLQQAPPVLLIKKRQNLAWNRLDKAQKEYS